MQYSVWPPKVTRRSPMPSVSQTLWVLQKVESGIGCSDYTQPCTIFSLKDFCGSTALAMPESEETKGQINCQAQQTSQLVDSLVEQMCLEAWGTLWTWTPEGKRREERKQQILNPLRQGTICFKPNQHWFCFNANLWETAETLWWDMAEHVWDLPSAAMLSWARTGDYHWERTTLFGLFI